MSRKGFSILETLLVVGIAAVVGVTAFMLVTSRQGTADLRGTAEQAVSALRTAQQNALTGASSTAWGVRFDNTTSTGPRFVLFASSSYATSSQAMSYAMSRRVSYDIISVPTSTVKDVVFGLRTGTTASTTVVFRLTGSTKSYVISISALGLVTATYEESEQATSTAPTVSGIAPASGANSGSISITSISGTNFVTGASVKLSRTGQPDITGTGFTVTSPTSITGGSFDITGVATGTWNVTVTNPSTESGACTNCFEVVEPDDPPTVSGASPPSLAQGSSTIDVTITGTNFVDGASVGFSGTGITVHSVTFVSQTSLTANVTVATSAAATARDVTVTNPDLQDGTCVGCFTVTASSPTVSGVSSSSRGQGATNATVTISGTNFVAGATPSFSGSGITVTTSTVASSTALTATLTIATSAATTARDVTVTNPSAQQGSCSSCFTVNPGPLATGAAPDTGPQGATGFEVSVTGTGFAAGAVASISGTGVTVDSTTFHSSTSLTLSLTIDGGASTGSARTITVTNTDGGQLVSTGLFTVASVSQTGYEPGSVVTDIGDFAWVVPDGDRWFQDDDPPSDVSGLPQAKGFDINKNPQLLFTGYNFGLPGGADIAGICVWMDNVGIVTSMNANQKFRIKLSWDGGSSFTTENEAMPEITNDVLPGDDHYFPSESAAQMNDVPATCSTWGRTWTDTELSTSNFGVSVRATTDDLDPWIYFDLVRVKVFYY